MVRSDYLEQADPEARTAVQGERQRQEESLDPITSEPVNIIERPRDGEVIEDVSTLADRLREEHPIYD